MKYNITLNESQFNLLREVINKHYIKEEEEANYYNGKHKKNISDIKKLRSKVTNRPPNIFIRDGKINVSADDGNFFGDYYGDFFNGSLEVDPRLEKIADKYDRMWDWDDSATIVLY